MMEKNYAGLDGFVWWMGVVENRNDPLKIGRCQVRIYGFHTDSLSDIPTEDLPWAHPVHSLNSRSFTTPKEADVVFGFFADGRSAQYPIMMGIIPGIETNQRDTGSGFHDLRSEDLINISPRKPDSVDYVGDGSGVSITNREPSGYPLQEDIGSSTISKAARYETNNTVIGRRQQNLVTSILTADGQYWDEPYPPYNPLYPFNSTVETESGHLFELDDTPENERISLNHRSGTYMEMFPSGSKVEKITKSNYQIVMGDDHLYVMGKVHVTLASDCYIKVLGDAKIEAGNDLSLKVAGNMVASVGEEFNIRARSLNIQTELDAQIISGTSQFFTAGENVEIVGVASVNIDGGATTSVNNGDSTSGTKASVPFAGFRDIPNEGSPGPEQAPASSNKTQFDAYSLNYNNPNDYQKIVDYAATLSTQEADSFGRSLLKDKVNGALVDPESNVAPQLCTFTAESATFLDKDSWALGTSGSDNIKFWEGFKETSYKDAKGYAIGYGTTGAAIDRDISPGETITEEDATKYLNQGVNNKYLPALKKYVKVPLTQNQVDGLLSFIYNVGPGNFASSTLLKKLNAQDYCGASDEMLRWNKSAGSVLKGLVDRRTREREIFLS